MDGRTSITHFSFVQAHREHRDSVSVLPCSPRKDNADLENYNRVQKKLRRGAKHLHKQPKKGNTMARADTTSKAGPLRGTRTFCDWTEMRLRRVACCLHCDNDDDTDKAGIKPMIEAVQNGAVDVLKGLQTKLMQLMERLHRKENNSFGTSESSEDKASQKPKLTASTKEPKKAEIHSVCDKFLHMVQDERLHLTADQQVAIAHWAIQMLKEPDLSGMSSGTTDVRPKEKPELQESDVVSEDGDSEKGSGHGGSQKDGIANSGGNRKDCVEGNGEIGQHNNGKKTLEPVDRACIGQPSDLSRSETAGHHATEISGTGLGEKEATEASQAAVGQKAAKAKQKDSGAFDLFDIGIALSKGDLDQRRMKRLRDGFLCLLNQSA